MARERQLDGDCYRDRGWSPRMTGATGEAAVLGIDLGTTEVKAGLVTLDGRLLGLARAGYRTDTDPASGRAEQDPEAWWGCLTTIVRKLAADAGAEIVAIGLDGHGPSLVAVDEAGRPTCARSPARRPRPNDQLGATTLFAGSFTPLISIATSWPASNPDVSHATT